MPPRKSAKTKAADSNGTDSHKRVKLDESAAPAAGTAAASSSAAAAATTSASGGQRPADWPIADSSIPIDLKVQDLPHKSSDTEWWYINGHVKIIGEAKSKSKPRASSAAAKKAAAAAAAAPKPINAIGTGVSPIASGSDAIPMIGREISLFSSFFRLTRSRDPKTAEAVKAHSVTWGLVDPTAKVYYADPVLDVDTSDIVMDALKKGSYALDGRLRKAFMEVCEKKHVPLPDRVMPRHAKVSLTDLDLDYCGQTFTKDAKGVYHIHCENPTRGLAMTLALEPKKKAVRQGHDGVVKIGLKAETMFYYFISRLQVTGTITIDGKDYEVAGNGWYDHEFGSADGKDKSIPDPNAASGVTLPMTTLPSSSSAAASSNTAAGVTITIQPTPKDAKAAAAAKADAKDSKTVENGVVQKRETQYAWNWMSLQLNDGTDVTATNLVNPDSKEELDNFAITIGPDSKRTEFPVMKMTPLNTWQSMRTTIDYPTKWQLTVPEAKLDLLLEAPFEDQEFVTLIARPAFWEGRLHVTGTYGGKPISGVGFIERHGFEGLSSLDGFFKKVSKAVLGQIDLVLPLKPTFEQVRTLMASDEQPHLMVGANINVFRQTIIDPLRQIIDRGGKSWRSFAMLLCIDCVGGYSPLYKHWLAMPEIMHVGSLIVDDIQDKSDTRRGGPACHLVHGDATAINAGTAAYFLSLHLLNKMSPWLTPTQRLEMYELYFATLRGGHAGQAFDIHGLDYMMDDVVKNGKGEELETRVKCTHRLKSAVPAGNLARMGAMVGGGSPAQVEGLGVYLESIGVAFQIIDDVLNLRGFKGNTKNRGEDIAAGKITYPVAKGMTRLPASERARVWGIIKSKPSDQKVIEAVCDDLEKCGAIEACVTESGDMVEDAWNKLDAVIPDSFYKMLLRAFGWFVLQRHY